MDVSTIRLELFGSKDTVFGTIKSTSLIEEIFKNLKKSIAFQIIMDTSGSMMSHFKVMRQSLMQFLQFIESGIELLPDDIKIYLNIVHFNTKVVQVFPVPPVEGYGEIVKGTYDQINASFPKSSGGYTYMHDALDFCQQNVWCNVPENTTSFTMLLTDGQPNNEDCMRTDSTASSQLIECKKGITDVYAKNIDLTVGIGSSRNYDFEFLKKLSKQDPTIAVQTIEIVDTIRQSFLDISTEGVPKNGVLTLKKKQVTKPSADGLKWKETEDTYYLELGKIGIAFQTMFQFKLKSATDTVDCQITFDIKDNNTNEKLVIPIKKAEPSHINMYEMLCVKEQLNQIDDAVDTDNSDLTKWLEELKNIETHINLHTTNDSLPEHIQLEWKEMLNQVRHKQDFMSQNDTDTYAIYSSTRSTSYNTSALRTLSSAPLRTTTRANEKKRYKCALCIDTVEKTIVYKCGHMFCMKCALTYYTSNGKECPTCHKPNMANLANIKLPIFPKEHEDKDGSIMKCTIKTCQNRYHGYNYPCMHVTSCMPCGKKSKGSKCVYEGCDAIVEKYMYYYSDYDS